jgi:CheY-like chemotaxis protein
MQGLIEWLARTEHMQSRIYRSAAEIFKDDAELGPLLNQLAEDEELHFQMMNRALDVLSGEMPQPPMLSDWISINKTKLEAPVLETADKITKGILRREDLLDYLVAGEFSEYNLIFLYVINSLKYNNREFASLASQMEYHKKSIEHYFKSLPDNQNYVRQISALPRVWTTSILVVEDYEPMRILLADILEAEGTVETTASGNMGLRKAANTFYDIILTDMTSPAQGGIQFYKQAIHLNPFIAGRFMFLLNTPTRKEVDFVRNNNLAYLEKPFSIEEIRKAIHEILAKPPQKRMLREAV